LGDNGDYYVNVKYGNKTDNTDNKITSVKVDPIKIRGNKIPAVKIIRSVAQTTIDQAEFLTTISDTEVDNYTKDIEMKVTIQKQNKEATDVLATINNLELSSKTKTIKLTNLSFKKYEGYKLHLEYRTKGSQDNYKTIPDTDIGDFEMKALNAPSIENIKFDQLNTEKGNFNFNIKKGEDAAKRAVELQKATVVYTKDGQSFKKEIDGSNLKFAPENNAFIMDGLTAGDYTGTITLTYADKNTPTISDKIVKQFSFSLLRTAKPEWDGKVTGEQVGKHKARITFKLKQGEGKIKAKATQATIFNETTKESKKTTNNVIFGSKNTIDINEDNIASNKYSLKVKYEAADNPSHYGGGTIEATVIFDMKTLNKPTITAVQVNQTGPNKAEISFTVSHGENTKNNYRPVDIAAVEVNGKTLATKGFVTYKTTFTNLDPNQMYTYAIKIQYKDKIYPDSFDTLHITKSGSYRIHDVKKVEIKNVNSKVNNRNQAEISFETKYQKVTGYDIDAKIDANSVVITDASGKVVNGLKIKLATTEIGKNTATITGLPKGDYKGYKISMTYSAKDESKKYSEHIKMQSVGIPEFKINDTKVTIANIRAYQIKDTYNEVVSFNVIGGDASHLKISKITIKGEGKTFEIKKPTFGKHEFVIKNLKLGVHKGYQIIVEYTNDITESFNINNPKAIGNVAPFKIEAPRSKILIPIIGGVSGAVGIAILVVVAFIMKRKKFLSNISRYRRGR